VNAPDPILDELSSLDAELNRLWESLNEALSYQWEAPPVPRPSDDTAERSKGPVSDPTPQIALDGRRLALRATVLEAERAVVRIRAVVSELADRVEGSVARWEGAPDDK